MRKAACCAVVSFRLARHGVPAAHLERVTRELQEHWEDLRAAGIEQGLSEVEAEDQADFRLGPPEQLAVRVITGFRQSSWLGRHPILALCFLPLVLTPLLMGAALFPVYCLDELTHFVTRTETKLDAYLVAWGLWALNYLAMGASVLGLSWQAWKSGLGLRWIMAVCSWCALTGLVRFLNTDTVKRHVSFGMCFPLWRQDIHTLMILLVHGLVAGGFFFLAWNAKRRGLKLK